MSSKLLQLDKTRHIKTRGLNLWYFFSHIKMKLSRSNGSRIHSSSEVIKYRDEKDQAKLYCMKQKL